MKIDPKGLLVSAATLAVLLALLGLAELGARVFGPPPAATEDPGYLATMLWADGPCLREENDGGRRTLVEVRPSDPHVLHRPPGAPSRFPAIKPAGVVRLAVVGESSANMMENALIRLVAQRKLGDRVEILPCSVPGADLAQTERRFDEVLHHDVDAVVLIFGHNLYFQNPADEGELRFQLVRSHSRLLSLLSRGLAEPPAPPGPAVRLPELKAALGRMATAADGAKAKVIVNTMASNLWFAPLASHDDAEERTPAFLAARYLADTGRFAESVAKLAPVEAEHPAALGEFVLAKWTARAGDAAGARAHATRARDLDEGRLRATTDVDELLRHACDGHPRCEVRDVERTISAAAPLGVPGWETFLDNCHLRSDALAREAAGLLCEAAGPVACDAAPVDARAPDDELAATVRVLVDQARSVPGITSARWWSNVSEAGAFALANDRDHAKAALAGLFDGDPFDTLDGEARGRLVVAFAEALRRAGRNDDALAMLQRADKTDAAAREEEGRVLLGAGRGAEAKAAFDAALKLDPTLAVARFDDTLLAGH